MRRSIKKCLLLSMASLMLAMSATSAVLATNTARADGASVYVENNVAVQGFEMIKGAAVRIDDVTGVSGMRFMVDVSEDFKNYLSETYEGASFTYGSLVDYKGRAVEELTVDAAQTDEFIKESNHSTKDVKIDAQEPEFNRIIKYFETETTPTEEQMQKALDLALSARYYVKVDSADDAKDCVIYAKANDNIRTARAVINAYGVENGTSNLRTDVTKIGTGVTDVEGDFEINVSDSDYEEITVNGLADGTYSVYYDAKKMGEVTAENGVIKLPFGANKAIANHNVFTLKSGDNAMQNYKVNVVDKVIKNADEFKTSLSTATTQHYVLGNDIEDVTGYPYHENRFTGMLDGRGFNIGNISYNRKPNDWTMGGLFYYFAGTLKNISFNNVSVSLKQGGIAFAVTGPAVLDNVFVNATGHSNADYRADALFGDAWHVPESDYSIQMNNVVVMFDAKYTAMRCAIIGAAGKTVTAENVYVSGLLSDGNPVPMAPDGDIAGCAYKTKAELMAMANNNEFETALLNENVLENVKHIVDKTATTNYYVEKWSTDNVVTLTNDHSAKFVANADLSDLGSTTIQKITANDVDLGYNAETGALDASKLTKGAATWDIYYSNNEVYKVTVNVVDAIIKDATDFKEILPKAKTEHIVLGNDIEKVEGYKGASNHFTGIFDGCEYSVKEISYTNTLSYDTDYTVQNSWLFRYMKEGATIKNIRFDNMILSSTQCGIAQEVQTCTLENVFINAKNETTGQCGAMFGTAWSNATITLNNVVVIFNTGATASNYSLIRSSTNLKDGGNSQIVGTNVYTSGNNQGQGPTAAVNILGCMTKSQDDLLAMANDSDTTLTLMAQNAIKNALGTN